MTYAAASDASLAPRAYTVAALAEHWGTSDTFVYDQIKAGKLRAFRLGNKLLRIKPAAVDEYEAQAALGAEPALVRAVPQPISDTARLMRQTHSAA